METNMRRIGLGVYTYPIILLGLGLRFRVAPLKDALDAGSHSLPSIKNTFLAGM